jgi:hypothetical protein
VTATIAQAWQKVRRTEQETALKLDMLQRGLGIEDIERLLSANSTKTHIRRTSGEPGSDDHLIQDLATCLGECRASASVIQCVMTAVRTADTTSKQALCLAIQAMVAACEGEVEEEQILAVVRGLSRPSGQSEQRSPEPVVAASIQASPRHL